MKANSLKIILLLLFCPSLVFAQYNPQYDLPVLFEDVQLKPVFPDSKTFVDAIPRFPIATIKQNYQEQKNRPGFDLTGFVHNHFLLPPSPVYTETDEFPPIETHIDKLWEKLVRKDTANAGSLIAQPNPYIVPGGRFNEMYYWDSYFTMLGLQVSEKEELIKNMVENFAWLIDEYGFIPNGTRTYYLTRSQPPFFSLMVELLAEIEGKDALVEYLPQLIAEHQFWIAGAEDLGANNEATKRVVRLEENTFLNRYWDNENIPRPEAYKEDIETASHIDVDPEITYRHLRAAAESGWDFSARWFKDGLSLKTIHTTDIIPVDLNCLLYSLEKTIAKAYGLKKNQQKSKLFHDQAEARKQAILKYCWNPDEGYFMDYDFVAGKPTGFFSLAGMAPLFFQIAEEDQAKKVAENIRHYFLYPGGLPSTLVLSGQQWDAPNGWAPLQWMTYRGLMHYQYNELADTLKKRWLETIENEYLESGKMLEKYNVVFPEIPGGGGEYPTQDGFGWTNGVYLKLLEDK